jgi:hypothetical protein
MIGPTLLWSVIVDLTTLIYYGTLITNKMGEQFKIIEYSPLL